MLYRIERRLTTLSEDIDDLRSAIAQYDWDRDASRELFGGVENLYQALNYMQQVAQEYASA